VFAVASLVATTLLAADGGAWWAHRGSGHPGSEHLGAAWPRGPAVETGPSRPAAASPDPAASPSRPTYPPGHPAAARRGLDTRLAAALAPLLRRHQGSIAAGVADPADGITAAYHAGRAFDTASIVKADILAVLLLQHQQTGTALSEDEQQLSTEMIEDSDNNAASALWDTVGGAPGMQTGNTALHVRGIKPDPSGAWGLTTVTVTSELHLLSDLTSPHSPLHASARSYELRLMRNVERDQAWGVAAAAAHGTRPAVKNGWLPLPPDGYWVINSIGVARHRGRQLLIAVLSDGQPSEAAGIAQVEAAARAAATVITAAESGCHGSQVPPE
jgi:hypothetical protein